MSTKTKSEEETARQWMSRKDMAAYMGRSLPWVDTAVKKRLIPPPIKVGAPMWIRSSVDAWIKRLQEEAIEAAQEKKTA